MSLALPEPFTRAVNEQFPDDLLSVDPADLLEYGRDRTREHDANPAAIAFPRTTDEVARLVVLCEQHGVAIVPSGGRTGLAGGAVATSGELVVSMRRMTRMEPVNTLAMTVRVQAGAITQAVHDHAAEVGLTWPVDFASKGSSTVGGNIATNAGGVKVIRYGVTRRWVLGLQVVTAGGEVLELNGELEKNNTGVDLRHLFIGSEGILGLITEATLKLTPLPGQLQVLLFAVREFEDILYMFESVRMGGFTVSAYEFFSDLCAARVKAYRKIEPPFGDKAPFYVLVELEDPDEDSLLEWVERMLQRPGVIDGTMAQSQAQARQLWELREGISESLSSTGLPHKNDVALPLRALSPFYREITRLLSDHYPDWEVCLFGHIGDGNVHFNTMKPDAMSKEEFLAQMHKADERIFGLVQAHRGSISAEHGIGLIKKPFLGYCRAPGEIAMLKALKRALDPDGLFNPGKVID